MIRRVDIIGGGISGLATAYDLAGRSRDIEIHVWERSSDPGGLAGTFALDGARVEKFYHHIFTRDRALCDLIHELGLGDDLVWRRADTGAYYFGRPYRLSTPLDLLRFTPLPLVSRLRLGWLALHARMIHDWQALDDIPARDYIIRTSGRRVYELVWEPLLRGKFGDGADDVSAAWLWCKFVDRGGSRDARGREVLGYVRGGLGAVFDRMVQHLRTRGHAVHLDAPVLALEGSAGEITTIVTASGSYRTDLVVATAQTPDIATLLPAAAASYAGALGRIRFLANVCLVMTLERPLSDFYWTNVTDPGAPFVGIVEQTRWADPRHYGGQNIAYISAYVNPDDRRLAASADELLDGYLPHIRKMFPEFEPAAVRSLVRWTASYAQPVVQVGYRALVPPIQSPIGNLLVCTMAQIYPHDRQVSNGVEMARRTVDLLCANGRVR